MNFLYMVCEEYHDSYSDYCTIVAPSSFVALDIASDYEYAMQGYPCVMDLHGPVHPSVPADEPYAVVAERERKQHLYQTRYIAPKLADLIS